MNIRYRVSDAVEPEARQPFDRQNDLIAALEEYRPRSPLLRKLERCSATCISCSQACYLGNRSRIAAPLRFAVNLRLGVEEVLTRVENPDAHLVHLEMSYCDPACVAPIGELASLPVKSILGRLAETFANADQAGGPVDALYFLDPWCHETAGQREWQLMTCIFMILPREVDQRAIIELFDPNSTLSEGTADRDLFETWESMQPIPEGKLVTHQEGSPPKTSILTGPLAAEYALWLDQYPIAKRSAEFHGSLGKLTVRSASEPRLVLDE